MRNHLLILSLMLATSATTWAANAYRWVDSEGQVHFSSQPPMNNSGAEQIKITTPTTSTAPASSTSTSTGTTATDADKPTSQPRNRHEIAKQKELTDKKAENCRNAQANKQNLSSSFSRRFQQPDGSVRPFTDAERTEQIQRADAAIRAFCN